MKTESVTNTSFQLPRELLRYVKVMAKQQNMTMAKYLCSLIREDYEKTQKFTKEINAIAARTGAEEKI